MQEIESGPKFVLAFYSSVKNRIFAVTLELIYIYIYIERERELAGIRTC